MADLQWMVYPHSGHPSAVGRAQDSESSPVKDRRSTTVPRNQPLYSCWLLTHGRVHTGQYTRMACVVVKDAGTWLAVAKTVAQQAACHIYITSVYNTLPLPKHRHCTVANTERPRSGGPWKANNRAATGLPPLGIQGIQKWVFTCRSCCMQRQV